MSNKPKSRRKESKASKTQRDMAFDLFGQAVCVVDTREPVVSLSYDDYSVYLDLHPTLPALREELAKEGRQVVFLGNRSQPITTREWEADYKKLDLSDRSFLVAKAVMRLLYVMPDADAEDRKSWSLIVATSKEELAQRGLLSAQKTEA